jgi:hypothetical protein
VDELEFAVGGPRDLPPAVVQECVVPAADEDEVVDVGLAQ